MALDLYEELGDFTGQDRAYYCLAYVYSVKGNLVESVTTQDSPQQL
jgi:hypothetical protein